MSGINTIESFDESLLQRLIKERKLNARSVDTRLILKDIVGMILRNIGEHLAFKNLPKHNSTSPSERRLYYGSSI